MKGTLRILVLSVLLLGASRLPAQEVSIIADARRLVMENALIRHVIRLSPTQPNSRIEPVSFFDKQAGVEMLAQQAASWFELSLNNELVTNQQPVWRYEGHDIRTLTNGGREVRYSISTAAGAVAGLRLTFVRQMFPGSTVLRERIELQAEPEAGLRLTKHHGKVHLVFPRYTFAVQRDSEVESEEIRIATWRSELLEAPISQASYDERDEESGWRAGRNLGENYMYHPRRIRQSLQPGSVTHHKGPIVLVRSSGSGNGWLMAYEHGSPDGDPEQDYIEIEQQRSAGAAAIVVRTKGGAYFDGESLPGEYAFSPVWTDVGLFHGADFAGGEATVWQFLYRWICEVPSSRKPLIYYNTWGMQRDAQKKGHDVRGILTLSRVLQEIAYASELGVDLFVLDDGWQDKWGDWLPNPERYPDGLEPLRQELANRGMTMGIWLATLAADSDAAITQQHPEWLIRDDNGAPIIGRWHRQVFCFVSDYQKYFIDVCKRLIDHGVRYFKWDGIDRHLCGSPQHHHGDSSQSVEERKRRQGYELIRYVTEAARALTEYQQDVIVEMDVTEPGRSVGLAFLSQARYFWMNNGAAWYGDRSPYRAKSMRMIPALFSGIIPTVLQTHANYPHNHPIYMAQRYNVNTSLLGGNGFWGDLSDMTQEERLRVGEVVRLARRVKPTVTGIRPRVIGKVGSSPEIYSFVDSERAEGQVIAFSGSALVYDHRVVGIDSDRLLAVARNSYDTMQDTLVLHFVFPMPDVSREAFLLSNRNTGIRVVSSTSWLRDASLDSDKVLSFTNGAPGKHLIRWPAEVGEPELRTSAPVVSTKKLLPGGDAYLIEIEALQADTEISIIGK